MRSQYSQHFCHDENASSYDQNVLKETHPIRQGYGAVLSWVASKVRPGSRVLDLGAGTGNLDVLFPPLERLVCVDVSTRMLEIAKGKLRGVPFVTFVVDDLLSYCSTATGTFDYIVSTYAIHHLTDAEKWEMLEHVPRLLGQDGAAVVGDLMFANEHEKLCITERHRELGTGIDEDIAEEYFWDVDRTKAELAMRGWQAKAQRFSELSWGILMLQSRHASAGSDPSL